MDIIIKNANLSGEITAVSSKSHLHRILLCALAAKGSTTIKYRGLSEDIKATISCIKAYGKDVEVTKDTIIIGERQEQSKNKVPTFDCGESGTTARLLLPFATALTGHFKMTGSGSLPSRPMGELISVMERQTVLFSSNTLPLEVKGMPLGGTVEIAGNISSQYISGLMLTLPLIEGAHEIKLTTPLSSRAYTDMTSDVQKIFGVTTEVGKIDGGQSYIAPKEVVTAEGDHSNGATWLCFNGITVKGLSQNSLQGDRVAASYIDLIKSGGAEIDIDETPDLLPVLAAFAASINKPCKFTNAARLKIKESDRLQSTAALILALGGRVERTNDSLTVLPSDRLTGGMVDASGDHRIVMAAAVAASRCKGEVKIIGAQAIDKSYPDFWEDFKTLGGEYIVI